MSFPYKLGRLPKSDDARDLMFARYAAPVKVTVPEDFGHEDEVKNWGMLGNDRYGCCVFAGAGHEVMLWTAEGDAPIVVTESEVLSDYHDVTGFDPKDPSTDRGAMIRDSLKHRQQVGTLAYGKRHKLGAYLALDPKNHDEIALALYLFGAVELGVEITASAQQQFAEGEPWDLTKDTDVLGGHDVPLVARRDGLYEVVTWGAVQKVTPAWWDAFVTEAWALLSPDMLGADGISPEGFDLDTLKADLASL